MPDLPIRFEDVSISTGGVTMLDAITLDIEAGPPTILIGPNGSGKTTLLRAAMGLVPATRGRVTWGGRETSPPSHRAFVFQKPAMLRRSAAANLRYALAASRVSPQRGSRRIEELLAIVGLGDLGERPARRMSGGEQKRLALARALAREPDVLLLDEPTASLDPAAAKVIEDVIRTVAASGMKVVMSTHDLGEARRVGGEIVLLHRGRIAERGPVLDFLDAPRTGEGRTFIAGELLI